MLFFRVRKSSWSLVIRTCSHYVSELGISVQWFPFELESVPNSIFLDHEWSWIICFSGTTSGGDICSISFSSSKCTRIIHFPVTRFQVARFAQNQIIQTKSIRNFWIESTKTDYNRWNRTTRINQSSSCSLQNRVKIRKWPGYASSVP